KRRFRNGAFTLHTGGATCQMSADRSGALSQTMRTAPGCSSVEYELVAVEAEPPDLIGMGNVWEPRAFHAMDNGLLAGGYGKWARRGSGQPTQTRRRIVYILRDPSGSNRTLKCETPNSVVSSQLILVPMLSHRDQWSLLTGRPRCRSRVPLLS